MKTLQRGSEIKRVSDTDAEKLVRSGDWKYIPKKTWKTEVRDANEAPKKKKKE